VSERELKGGRGGERTRGKTENTKINERNIMHPPTLESLKLGVMECSKESWVWLASKRSATPNTIRCVEREYETMTCQSTC
jgi:hypothetical protein